MEHTESSPDGRRAPLVLLSSSVATPGTNVIIPAGSPLANTKSEVPSGTSMSTSTVKVCCKSLDLISARPTPSTDSPSEGGDRLILSRQSAATSCGSPSMNRLTVATKPNTSAFIGTDPVRSYIDELFYFDRCPVSARRACEPPRGASHRQHRLNQRRKIAKDNGCEKRAARRTPRIMRVLDYSSWRSRLDKTVIFLKRQPDVYRPAADA